MDSKKYEKIRNKIIKMNFEEKYKQLSLWLFSFSFIGNIGSIFFAYFLIYPIFNDALIQYLDINVVFLSSFFTILILFMFELIKRIVLKIFSFDFIKNKYSFKNINIVSWFLISLPLILLSFYFSINGAMKFADKNNIIQNKYDKVLSIKKDSLKNIYDEEKKYFIDQNTKLREQNSNLRNNIIETPLNYITARKEYQKIIDKNIDIIKENNIEINKIEEKYNIEYENIKNEIKNKIIENDKNNEISIIVFILISTLIEFLIITGIYFKVYYDYTVYKLNENKLESYFRKRDNYLILLDFIYKRGQLNVGDVVMGLNKLKQILNDNNVPNSNKLAVSFFTDLEYHNIVKTQGKKKYFEIDYETAKNIIIKTGENIDVFNKIK